MTSVVSKKCIAGLLVCALLLSLVSVYNIAPAVAYTSGNGDSTKMLALTFDDGPSEYTDRLLDILSANDCKATFFVVGSQVTSYANTLQRAHDIGCEILGHSWDHEHLADLTADEVRENLYDTNNVIENLLGHSPTKYRPPYGETGGNIREVSAEVGLSIILWSVNPEDWAHENEDIIYDRIMTSVINGSIILCHDIFNATVNAMERVIPELVSRGYSLVTASELLGETTPGEIYRGPLELPIPLYTVQDGDTLASIAENYHTTIYTIKVLNNLTSDAIYLGQQLQLLYLVQPSNSLWLIAKNYNTTVAALMDLNGLTDDLIYPGQQFCIPKTSCELLGHDWVVQEVVAPTCDEQGYIVYECSRCGETEVVVGVFYVVQSGDSLWSISKAYGVTVDAIKALNGFTSDGLSVGMVLQIPVVNES